MKTYIIVSLVINSITALIYAGSLLGSQFPMKREPLTEAGVLYRLFMTFAWAVWASVLLAYGGGQ